MKETDFSKLIMKAKETSAPGVSQRVVPVQSMIVNEQQFSFYIDKSLLKRLKFRAIEEETSIKELLNKSIFEYLERLS